MCTTHAIRFRRERVSPCHAHAGGSTACPPPRRMPPRLPPHEPLAHPAGAGLPDDLVDTLDRAFRRLRNRWSSPPPAWCPCRRSAASSSWPRSLACDAVAELADHGRPVVGQGRRRRARPRALDRQPTARRGRGRRPRRARRGPVATAGVRRWRSPTSAAPWSPTRPPCRGSSPASLLAEWPRARTWSSSRGCSCTAGRDACTPGSRPCPSSRSTSSPGARAVPELLRRRPRSRRVRSRIGGEAGRRRRT